MDKVNINIAGLEELQRVIHIGPVRAQRIIDDRQSHKFRDVFELSVITGLGMKRIQDVIIQGLVSF